MQVKSSWLSIEFQTWQIAGVKDLVHVECRKGKFFVRNNDHGIASADRRSKKRDETEERSRFHFDAVADVVVGADDADDADRFVQTNHGAVQLSLLDCATVLKMRKQILRSFKYLSSGLIQDQEQIKFLVSEFPYFMMFIVTY